MRCYSCTSAQISIWMYRLVFECKYTISLLYLCYVPSSVMWLISECRSWVVHWKMMNFMWNLANIVNIVIYYICMHVQCTVYLLFKIKIYSNLLYVGFDNLGWSVIMYYSILELRKLRLGRVFCDNLHIFCCQIILEKPSALLCRSL